MFTLISLVKSFLSSENSTIFCDFRTLRMSIERFNSLIENEEHKLDNCYNNDLDQLKKEVEVEEKKVSQEHDKTKNNAIVAKKIARQKFNDVEEHDEMMIGNKLRANAIVDTYNGDMKKIQKYIENTNLISQRKLDELRFRDMEDTFGLDGCYSEEFLVLRKLKKNFFNSMVITIYATVKKHLNKIYEYRTFAEASKNTYSSKCYSVEDVLLQLKTYGGVNLDEQDLVFLSELKEIRNLIAEEDGALYNKTDTEKTKIRNMTIKVPIKQRESRDFGTQEIIKTDYRLDLTPEFIESCLQQSGEVLGKIMAQVLKSLEEEAGSANT